MIEMPIFPDERWYLIQVKKLFMSGNVKDENVEKRFDGSKREAELIKLLSKVIDASDVSSVSAGKNIFEKIILAPFPVLNNIFTKVNGYARTVFQKEKAKDVWVVLKEWEIFCTAYDTFVRRHKNTELVERYGIKCCPYCNENYIFNRKDKAGAQMDHFFPKERYPLFAISLYNLVPSCTTCNHIKQEKILGVSPHDHTRNFDHMRISYTPKKGCWITDYKQIDIVFQYEPSDRKFETDMRTNDAELLLDAAYQNHRDYLQEIVNKAFLYNDVAMTTLLNSLTGAFHSEEEMLRIVFGNYIEKDKLLKRPLSKMTRDLLTELKILKE